MSSRNINFRTRIYIFFQRPYLFIIGLFLLLFGITLIALICASLKPEWGEYSNEEYLNIVEHGDTLIGQVYNTEIDYTTQINGENPAIIYYNYLDKDIIYSDHFQTLDNGSVGLLDESDQVIVYKYNGKTVLGEFKPFQFPRWIIAILPGLLGVIGMVIVVIVMIKSFIEIRFLRTATWKNAILKHVFPQDGRRFFSAAPGLMLHYEFQSKSGQTIHGYSFTYDLWEYTAMTKGDQIDILVSKKSESKTQAISTVFASQNGWVQL